MPEIKNAAEVGIVPATQQQHGLAQQGGHGCVSTPTLGVCRIAFQPLQCHACGVVLLEQVQPFAEEAAPLQGITDCMPTLGVAIPSAALGG